jgi:hypothetical protein
MEAIYIASPYTIGDKEANVRAQIECADKLLNMGFYPYVPLLNHYQDMYCPRPEEDWIQQDFYWLAKCNYVLRLPGDSKGADREVRLAEELGIPVFYNLETLIERMAK